MKRQSKRTFAERQRKAPNYTLSDRMISLVAEITDSEADRTGDARAFIEFMLVALRDALLAVKRSVGKGVVKSVVKILDLIAQYPDVTRERLAKEVGLSVRGVEKNLAQLKSEGKIVRVGGRKGGHWEVAKRTPTFS